MVLAMKIEEELLGKENVYFRIQFGDLSLRLGAPLVQYLERLAMVEQVQREMRQKVRPGRTHST